MRRFKPSLPYAIPMLLLKPQKTTAYGAPKVTYPTIEEAFAIEENMVFCSFKTYGGTEKAVNGTYVIEDTANFETYYRPDIKSDCRLVRLSDSAVFEILNEPEDVEGKHRFLTCKLKRRKGDA